MLFNKSGMPALQLSPRALKDEIQCLNNRLSKCWFCQPGASLDAVTPSALIEAGKALHAAQTRLCNMLLRYAGGEASGDSVYMVNDRQWQELEVLLPSLAAALHPNAKAPTAAVHDAARCLSVLVRAVSCAKLWACMSDTSSMVMMSAACVRACPWSP